MAEPDTDPRIALGVDVPDLPLGTAIEEAPAVVEKVEPEKKGATVEDLQRELSQTKAAMQRQAAELNQAQRAAQEFQNHAGRADTDARTSAIASIDNAIGARNAHRSVLMKERTLAMQAGDYDTEAKLTEQLMDLAAEMRVLKDGKMHAEREFEAQKAQWAQQQQNQQRQQQNAATPVEQFLARTNIRGASADWIRKHPNVIDRPNKLAAADEEAVAELGGIEKRDTPEYFAIVERFLGLGSDDRSTSHREDPEPIGDRQSRSAAAAPPTKRSTPVSGGQRTDGGIPLNPQQRRAAEISGVTEEEYAQNLVAAKRAGLIN